MSRSHSYPVGLMLGLLGLSPVVHVVVCLSGHMSSAFILEKLKLYKAIELVFEALPQSLLQAWVGVTMGHLDPSSPRFSALVTTSLCISTLGAGVTCFTLEAIGRNGNTMRRDEIVVRSRYGVMVVLLRSAQHGVLVLSTALLGCAVGSWAVTAVILGVTLFFCSGYEAVDRERTYRHAAFLYLLFVVVVVAIAAAFVFADHVDNNFADKHLDPGGPGDPQYYFCGDRSAAIVPAIVCFTATLVLFPASAAVDPILGLDFCKARTCESAVLCSFLRQTLETESMNVPTGRQRIDLQSDKMRSRGASDADILAAKIAAVFQWADVIKGDGLCPAEIMRFADELPIHWGSTVIRSKDRRPGSAVNFVDAQELVQIKWHDCGEGGRATESLSWVSVWELDKYGALCNILGVEPLAQHHTHSTKTSLRANGARLPMVCISSHRDEKHDTEAAFAAVTPGPLGSPRCTTAAGHHRRLNTQAGTIDRARFERVCQQNTQVYALAAESGPRLVVSRPYGELWFEDLRLSLHHKPGCREATCCTR